MKNQNFTGHNVEEYNYSSKELADILIQNMQDYHENVREFLIKVFETDNIIKQSWIDWFNGK